MGIDFNKFEDWGEPREARGRRKFINKDISPKKDKLKPTEKILAHMKRISPDLVESELLDYRDWVTQSIMQGEVVFEDSQLLIESNNQKNQERTKVTHKPSQMYGLEIGTQNEKTRAIQAKAKAFFRADAHIKLWINTDEAFKDRYLNLNHEPRKQFV